jgi:RNA polymerase sigma-70 factor (ECF subfamily)
MLQLDDEARQLRRALDKLPNKLKQTLLLCEFSAFSHAEIAMILAIPVGTVGSRRNKALKLLHKTLAGKMLAGQG